MDLLHTAAPYWDVWRAWFLSDGVGIVVVAPLVIGLGQVWREPPSLGESIEGAGVVGLTALVSFYVMNHQTGSWLSFTPGATVLPLLLWLAARCQPAFGIAGAFSASVAVIFATTYGFGRFGDATFPILERVKGAQAAATMVTLYTLVLTALFAQRQRAEEGLQHREAELAEAQRVARIGSWYWDSKSDVLVGSDELYRIYGFDPATPPTDFRREFGRRYTPDDLQRLKAAARRAMRTGAGYELDLRAFRNGTPIWVTARGEVVCNGAGQIAGLRGTVQDITERKRAEQTLSERNAQLALAGQAALVGSYAYESDLETMKVSEGYCAMHGLPEGTTETTRREWRARVYPEDLARLEESRARTFRDQRKGYNVDYRIVRAGGDVRWIESRSFVSYDDGGRPRRIIGVNIDITERKRAEDALRLLNAELDHRVKNTLATVTAVVSHTQQGSRSVANFVAALDGRIRSMATTHELLSSRRWQGILLAELVRRELAPYAAGSNTDINGPDVVLGPDAGQAMAMVLHELATNAAKYGALSTKDGCVSIRWDRRLNGHPPCLVLEWQEIGGPPVVAPDKSGFGTSTICDLIPYEFGGTVDLTFPRDGVRCRVELPADWLSGDEEVVSTAIARASAQTEHIGS